MSSLAESRVPDQEGATGRSLAYPWIVVLFLMLLYTSSYIDRMILNLLVKPIRADFSISDTRFSLLTGIAFIGIYTLAGIPLGRLVDRWNRRWLIAIGVFAWSLMTGACGLANSYWRLFAARIGVGVGEATLSPAAYSLVSDYFPPTKLSRALSVYTLGNPLGSGLALIIGGLVIKALSEIGPLDLPVVGVTRPWQVVFLIVGLPGVLLALLTLLVVREPARHEMAHAEHHSSFGAVLRQLWANRRVYGAIFLGLGIAVMPAYGANAWYPAYLQRVHGFTIADAGLFLGLSTLIFGTVGSIVAGTLADHLVAKGRADGHLIVGLIFTAGVLICVGLGTIVPVRWLSLALVSATSFFANTWTGVNAAALQMVTPNRMRGQVSALYLFVAALLAIGFGPTAVAIGTDYIFRRDDAVGSSLALNAVIFTIVGALIIQSGRGPIRRLAGKPRSDRQRSGL